MARNDIFKCYEDLIKLQTFEERLEYLMVHGSVGEDTFGSRRYLNQILYTRDKEWQRVRDKVIARDEGRDLGVQGHEMDKYIQVHHIMPLTVDDILNRDPKIFDTNNLICCSDKTHKIIHYSRQILTGIPTITLERSMNDTCPWKQIT